MNKFTIVLNSFDVEEYEKYESIEAFIVGNNEFGIRMPIDFQIIDIKKIKEKSKKKIFVAVNKIFHEYEIKNLKEYLLNLKDLEVDGIIFSDFSVYKIIKDMKWKPFLSYSTDTTISSSSFSTLAKENDIDNIEISKELTFNEIKQINKKKESSITVFLHGHIYMYNSFRKIVSSYFDNYNQKVPNEKLLLYDHEREAYYPIIENDKGTHVLSFYDQMSIKYLKEIFSTNIDYLKMDSFGYTKEDFIFIFKKYNDLLILFNKGVEDNIFENQLKESINQIEKKVDYKKFNTGFLKKKTIF